MFVVRAARGDCQNGSWACVDDHRVCQETSAFDDGRPCGTGYRACATRASASRATREATARIQRSRASGRPTIVPRGWPCVRSLATSWMGLRAAAPSFSTIFGRRFADDRRPFTRSGPKDAVVSIWNVAGVRLARTNGIPSDRSLRSMSMCLWRCSERKTRDEKAELVKRFGAPEASFPATTHCREAVERAPYLGRQIQASCWRELGLAGLRFVEWLMSVERARPHAPAARVGLPSPPASSLHGRSHAHCEPQAVAGACKAAMAFCNGRRSQPFGDSACWRTRQPGGDCSGRRRALLRDAGERVYLGWLVQARSLSIGVYRTGNG